MHGQLQDQVLGLRAVASTRGGVFLFVTFNLICYVGVFCHVGAAEEKAGAAYGRCAWWPASQSPRNLVRRARVVGPRSAPCHLGTESPTSPSPSPSSKLSLYVALFSVHQLQVLIEAIDQFTSAVNTQLALRLPGVCNGVVVFPSHAVLIDVPH